MRKPPERSAVSTGNPMRRASCLRPPGNFQGKGECICRYVTLVGNTAARADIQRFGQYRDLVALCDQVALEVFQIVQRGAVASIRQARSSSSICGWRSSIALSGGKIPPGAESY